MAFVPGMFKLERGTSHDFIVETCTGGVVAYAEQGGPWFTVPEYEHDVCSYIEKMNEVRIRPGMWERASFWEAMKDFPG